MVGKVEPRLLFPFLWVLLFVGILLISKGLHFHESLLMTSSKEVLNVHPLAPINAKHVDLINNPFTLEGHMFWSSIVGMNITPGIFDDCRNLAGELTSRHPLPKVFHDMYGPFKSKLKTVLSDGKPPEGYSLKYKGESLVFWNIITRIPHIETVCETGFNTGSGTLLWLTAKPNVHVYSFDIGDHPYAKPMADYIQEQFPGRHNITWGDSTKTLPLFVKKNPRIQCDIIYVDGGHTYAVSKKDFENFSKLGYTGSVVILDNYPDYRLTFMKDLGGMWEDNRRLMNILEVFKCTYGRMRKQGFSFGLLTKTTTHT
ncbi:hypothetical protein CAPTEDRAFT_212787 [Capitella teleta]|uniref:Methyltransferase domain-containing protein n=1 Tax=Capitella teleta TaxID=283909 RepID=R7TAX2_CAPTE|nr:hypothetical protein CAPTEDRAFT_212787 [Capitella teleta]|eukprot:ELT90662.1 hypothetical protein CAPTEDRAFT_212787 [Capitella teleta]